MCVPGIMMMISHNYNLRNENYLKRVDKKKLMIFRELTRFEIQMKNLTKLYDILLPTY